MKSNRKNIKQTGQQQKNKLSNDRKNIKEIDRLSQNKIEGKDIWALNDVELDKEMWNRFLSLDKNSDCLPRGKITSHRKGIGWIIVLLKKILRAITTPYSRLILQKQNRFNREIVDFHLAEYISMQKIKDRINTLEGLSHEIMKNQKGLIERQKDIFERMRHLELITGHLEFITGHLELMVRKNKNILFRLEETLKLRKPSIGIYDFAFHYVGGAQKYGCTIAYALQDEFDVTLIANRKISLQKLQRWYNLDLSRCRIKIVRVPFYEGEKQDKDLIDPWDARLEKDNPFDVISKESANYDIFINNCTLEMVYPTANISVFICHFPEREKNQFFYVDKYTEIVYNSLYTAEWIKKRWHLDPHKHIYPPVDMEASTPSLEKENIILSVSRFDPGGNKQQLKMVRVFQKVIKQYPEIMKEWKLVLAGGSITGNPYLEKIKKAMSEIPELEIELKVNIPADELKTVYQKAKLFWHFSGLDQSEPAKIEHFGMTTVEAMQNGCVPIVFNGGGQTEVIEDLFSGFLFSSQKELMEKTIKVIKDSSLMKKVSQKALWRGKQFNKEIFIAEAKKYFSGLLKEYRSIGKSESPLDKKPTIQ